MALGLYVSFSGVVSFKKSDELRAIAREVPLDPLLVETDAPFLAPEPHRGRTNEPAYVVHTAAAVAKGAGSRPRKSPRPRPRTSSGCSRRRGRPVCASAALA